MKLRRLLQYPLAIGLVLGLLGPHAGCNKPSSTNESNPTTASTSKKTTPNPTPTPTPSNKPLVAVKPGPTVNPTPKHDGTQPRVGRERIRQLLLAQRQNDGLGRRRVFRRSELGPNRIRVRTPDQQAMRKPLVIKLDVNPKDAQVEVLRNDVRVGVHKANNGRVIVRNLPAGGITSISKTPVLFEYKLRVFRSGYFDRELKVSKGSTVQKQNYALYESRVLLRPRP